MSLITCCPSCGTKFRVVADQLRISDGWVRCGRCQEVFDAAQALEEAPPAAPAPVPAAPEALAPVAVAVTRPEPEPEPVSLPAVPLAAVPVELSTPAPRAEPVAAGYELPAPVDLDSELAPEAWLDQPMAAVHDASVWRASAAGVVGATLPREPVWDEAAPWEPQQALPAEEAQAAAWQQALQTPPQTQSEPEPLPPMATELEAQEAVAPEPAQHVPAAPEALQVEETDDLETEALPSFVKEAQRKAWWNQPSVRFAMGMLVILLPLALLLQIAVHERNTLVAWKPQWRPFFQTMCIALRCELAPRQHIAAVVLTGSSFRQDAQPHRYRLELSIQNQATTSVATPAVELTLTDAQDQVLVRKVLLPSDIGAPVELAAQTEWEGSLSVVTQGLHLAVSGYRVLAFYP